MDTKICRVCKTDKAVSEFSTNSRRSDGLQTDCMLCRAAYNKIWYTKHRERIIRKQLKANRKQRKDRQKWLYEYLLQHPCVDCGNTNPVVLQFDHLHTKEFAIAKSYKDVSLQKLINEIANCDVVCANCHMIRTANRRNWYKNKSR